MIDPLTSLAFAVHSNKGAYALLLGSGISRSSSIPTGWEVVLDLIRKIAALEGHDCEPDPAGWFKAKSKAEPDYSQLLDGIAKTSTERQQLLRGYFEATDDEREEGLKLPSPAHRAIARLVASGHVRVILTTNFDRLIEQALEDLGISPSVISTADQIAGSLPLVHSQVTVIKLHGDYLDTRILNTESELAFYNGAVDGLLDRILDEYGLIVSGWSGDWDIALRAAIERCPCRRFTTFWATRSNLSGKAESLAKHRQAQIVLCKDADQFFASVEEKVRALEDLAAPHLLSAEIAVATVKRHVVDPTCRIRMHDLIHSETEKLFTALHGQEFEPTDKQPTAQELYNRTTQYHSASKVLLAIMITGCYWDGGTNKSKWASVLQRIADSRGIHGGSDALIRLRHYPTILLIYGAGIASIAAKNFDTLTEILCTPKTRNQYNEQKEICQTVHTHSVLNEKFGKLLPNLQNSKTPTSDLIHITLRGLFFEYFPRDEDFDDAFDRFEYFMGLVNADLSQIEYQNGWWGPVGRRILIDRYVQPENRLRIIIDREISAAGDEWPPVKAGLFGGSLSRAINSKSNYDSFLSGVNWY